MARNILHVFRVTEYKFIMYFFITINLQKTCHHILRK